MRSSGGHHGGSPKLVATDLDGTLLGRDRTISDRTLAALAALPVPHVIVTGRPLRWLAEIYAVLPHAPLAVVANGAGVYDPDRDELLHSAPIDPADLARACETLRAAIPDAVFAVESARGGGLLHEAAHPIGPWEHRVPSRRQVRDLAELVAEPAAKLLVRAGSRDSDEFTALVAATLAGGFEATHSSSTGMVEISAAGVTKASGLAWVAARLGVAAADVVAFGDMPNDLPMLSWAGIGVAMGNAHPAVVAAADEVTTSNAEDGVAVWLEHSFALR